MELENATVKIKQLEIENRKLLDVQVSTPPIIIEHSDTVYASNYIVEDSTVMELFQIIGTDTQLIATIEKPEQYCPTPGPPNNIFEIIIMVFVLLAGIVAWAKKRKGKKDIS